MAPTAGALTELPVSFADIEKRIVGAADSAVESVQSAIDGQIKVLLEAMSGKDTDAAMIEPLLRLLQQKMEVEAVRASIGEALAEIVLASADAMEDEEVRAAAVDIALHFLRSPDEIEVAAICSFFIQVGKDIDAILAACGAAACLGASFYLNSPLFAGSIGRPSLDFIVDLGQKDPETFGAAGQIARHLLAVPEMEDQLLAAFQDIIAEALKDPIQLMIDAGGLVAGVLQVIQRLLQEEGSGMRETLAEMRREPMAVGEVMGTVSGVVVSEVLFLFLGPEDIILIAGRQAGPLLRVIGHIDRLTGMLPANKAVARAGRSRLPVNIDSLRKYARALITAASGKFNYRVSAKVLTAIQKSKILTPELRKLLREDLVPRLLQGAIENFRRLGPYRKLKAANGVMHKDLFVLHALELDTLLPGGAKDFTSAMRELSSVALRDEWYEAAHLVDRRLLDGVPAWKPGFDLLEWADGEVMPALNVASSKHTLSVRRSLVRLAKAKEFKIPLTREDIAPDAFSITDIMNRKIVIKGGLNSEAYKKEALLFIDPARPGKLSDAIESTLQVWNGESLVGTLSPEAEDLLKASIAKLRQSGM